MCAITSTLLCSGGRCCAVLAVRVLTCRAQCDCVIASALLIFQSLETPTAKTWAHVVHLSLFGSFVVLASVGVFGYLAFGEETYGNVLVRRTNTRTMKPWHCVARYG